MQSRRVCTDEQRFWCIVGKGGVEKTHRDRQSRGWNEGRMYKIRHREKRRFLGGDRSDGKLESYLYRDRGVSFDCTKGKHGDW